MPHRPSLFAVAVVFALCLVTSSSAYAGNTVPWLTGTFGGWGQTDSRPCFAGPNGGGGDPGVPASEAVAIIDPPWSVATAFHYTSLTVDNQGGYDGQEGCPGWRAPRPAIAAHPSWAAHRRFV